MVEFVYVVLIGLPVGDVVVSGHVAELGLGRPMHLLLLIRRSHIIIGCAAVVWWVHGVDCLLAAPAPTLRRASPCPLHSRLRHSQLLIVIVNLPCYLIKVRLKLVSVVDGRPIGGATPLRVVDLLDVELFLGTIREHLINVMLDVHVVLVFGSLGHVCIIKFKSN